ncbi:MAG: hypothetical protein AB8B87_01755 [Granulosicoccus sp.]
MTHKVLSGSPVYCLVSLSSIFGLQQTFCTLVCVLLFTFGSTAFAQDQNPVVESTGTSSAQPSTATQQSDALMMLERLQYIQNVLTQKLAERSSLGERIEQANEQDKADLRRQADDLSEDIRQLRSTLENIAIGGLDISLFVNEQDAVKDESNWQEDIAMIAQPVIDSLKDLTEKPRKLKALNDEIALHEQELDTATQALRNLQPELSLEPGGELGKSLARLERIWRSRRDDAENAIEIARFQISDLRGDKPIAQTIFAALIDFLKGRGLTLALALLTALIVWFGVRFLLRGYRATIASTDSPEQRTRYRLAAYSVHAMTFLLILIAIFVVFYERGDVLLLGLLILLIIGLALGIRQLLPQYISEARLLLNVGAMREAERIVYRGLPWRVESINMFTVLRNPELHGVLRIPLAEFHGVSSRPSGNDSWFPTSRGDSVLMPDGNLMEVLDQNPDTVELRIRGGQQVSVPTHEFYNKEMINLSRGQSFGVVTTFGVDYQQQNESLSTVPKVLRDAIRKALTDSDLESFIKDVRVELKAAGESSIDYWLLVTMDTRAAKSYQRIQRMTQSACVQACTEQSWNIPYPHVSLVKKDHSELSI